jgi:flagellar basal-body rod modification protein FlgD
LGRRIISAAKFKSERKNFYMATIGTLFPAAHTASGSTPAAKTASATNTSTSASSSSSGSNTLSNQATFLQLLVAQLQYQDPTQPMDGTTFVTQLATFSDLQANTGTRQDLDGIAKQYLGTIPSQASSTTTTSPTAGA